MLSALPEDPVSQKNVRDALLVLSATLASTKGAFGTKEEIDPILHLVAAASTWGGNPANDAVYVNVTPDKNDGKTVYQIVIKDVPVDGFWSIPLYITHRAITKRIYLIAYTINNVTAKEKGIRRHGYDLSSADAMKAFKTVCRRCRVGHIRFGSIARAMKS